MPRHKMKPIWELDTLAGSHLSPEDRRLAKRMFVHRFTRDHKPTWAFQPRQNGEPYPVQFASDDDWLAHTEFAVDSKGRLKTGYPECLSRPTWPDNPELRTTVHSVTTANTGFVSR